MAGEVFRTRARSRRAVLAGGLLACALAIGAVASPALAETLVVTNLEDSGAGSLREAIKNAAPGDTIVVPAGQITLTSEPLEVKGNLTIVGAGSGATTISGNEERRVFTITGAPVVTLQGMTITHGKDPKGAGINAAGGELTLQDVLVTANHAGGEGVEGLGGGLDLGPGTYKLIESAVTANTAGGGTVSLGVGRGGGIEYSASAAAQTFTLTLERTRVSGNHAGGGGEAKGFGAGIDANAGEQNEASISVSLSESSLSSNVAGGGAEKASGSGGGLELAGTGAKDSSSLKVDRSAITGNSAGGNGLEALGSGGGIDYPAGGLEATRTLSIVNTTIANNKAGGAGADGSGGGVLFGGGKATLSHATIAGNTAGGGGGVSTGAGLDVGPLESGGIDNSVVAANPGGNCASAVPSAGHNIDDASSCGFAGTADKTGVDAKLGPLGSHGGVSQTQMPLAGSPAIDAADPAACPPTDQRGVTRPQGGGCDIGSVEVAQPVVVAGSVSGVGAETATITGGTITPNFSQTTYHVDYGTTTAYGTFTNATNAGEGGLAQPVAAALSRLKPQTLYHFRFVASNAAGTVVSGDQTFTTSKAAAVILPVIKPVPALPPIFSSASMTHTRFRVGRAATAISARAIARTRKAPLGTRFRFRLSAAAKVQITITRSVGGLRRGRSCVAPTTKLRRAHARRCSRTQTVGKLIRAKLHVGSNTVVFSGRIGARPLSPRAYKAILSASNAGGRARPVTLAFTIVR